MGAEILLLVVYIKQMRRSSAFLFTTLALGCALGLTGCVGDTSSAPAHSNSEPVINELVDPSSCPVLPDGFVYLNTVDATIETELRYASTDNFTGEVVTGYEHANTPVLRADAAKALSGVQQQLTHEGIGLLVYDGFRPTRAVTDFVAWSQTTDERMRDEYYPSLAKSDLFALGYIAEQSNHSLGGTVDLTLIDLETGNPLDMGGSFDLFDERSHYDFTEVTPNQNENRTILREAMIDAGFNPYAQEWWHFSYPVPEGAERLDFALEPCG